MKKINIIIILIILPIICNAKWDDITRGIYKNPGIINSDNGLFLREKPSIKSKSIYLIKYKELIEIIDKNGPKDNLYNKDGQWNYISYEGTKGWVWGNFIITPKEAKIYEIFRHGGPTDTGRIYFYLYDNKTFDLIFIDPGTENVYYNGNWSKNNLNITLIFNNKGPDTKYLFHNGKEYYANNVKEIGEFTYEISDYKRYLEILWIHCIQINFK